MAFTVPSSWSSMGAHVLRPVRAREVAALVSNDRLWWSLCTRALYAWGGPGSGYLETDAAGEQTLLKGCCWVPSDSSGRILIAAVITDADAPGLLRVTITHPTTGADDTTLVNTVAATPELITGTWTPDPTIYAPGDSVAIDISLDRAGATNARLGAICIVPDDLAAADYP